MGFNNIENKMNLISVLRQDLQDSLRHSVWSPVASSDKFEGFLLFDEAWVLRLLSKAMTY